MNEGVTGAYRRHGEKIGNSENETQRDNVVDSTTTRLVASRNDVITLNATRVDLLHEKLEEMRQTVLDDLNERLNDMMSEVIQRIQVTSNTENGYQKDGYDNSKRRRNGKLGDKQFFPRNSYLTDLYEVNHIRTLYNIFVVMLIILFLNTAVHDYIETGTMHLGINTIKLGFAKITTGIQMWILMVLSTFAVYLGFCVWAQQRVKFAPKSLFIKIVDYGFLSAFIVYQLTFLIISTKYVVLESMGFAPSLTIMMEEFRMLMKNYAFVRSTAPRILIRKTRDDASYCPGFSKFLYFMFAPTLVYRDEYPRTKQIRWKIVLLNFAELVLVTFYVAFILERFIIPPFEKFGPRVFEFKAVILTIFSTALPGLVLFLFGFYTILHSFQNFFAELLRFADRLFYKDWWNCITFDAYYRNWNIIVHDWLYTYIYKDVYEIFQNKVIAIISVFSISVVFHEFILAFALRFFYPVLMILFGGFGMPMVFVSEKYIKSNIFLWFTLFIGNGIVFTLYSMEFYARVNCPPYNDKLSDLLLPRSWVCHIVTANTTSALS